MRIAHLLPNMATGGRERMTATLAAQQLSQGHDVSIVGYEPADANAAQMAVPSEYVQLDRTLPDFPATLTDALSSADIIHAQGHVSAHMLREAGISGIPTLATLHVGMERSWRWLWPIRQGLRAMRSLVAVSAPMARLYGRIAGRDIAVLPNGIDLGAFAARRARPPRGDEPFRFAMLSRLHPVKRHSDAVAAMDILTQQGINAQLWIAGDGCEWAKLEALTSGRDNIFMCGAVGDAAQFLRDKHGFLICSDKEGMPLAAIEAMAAGLPIVATRVGGLPEMLPACASFAKPRKPTKLAAAMRDLIGDGKQWHDRSSASALKASEYSAQAMAARYQGLYERLLMR